MTLKLDPNLTPAQAGKQVYETVWLAVRDYYYQPRRLQNWAGWQNRFDAQIVDIPSGLEYARKMLASLGDSRTILLGKDEAAKLSAMRQMDDAEDVVCSTMLPHNIGYVNIVTFSRVNLAQYLEDALGTIASADGLIIDLRGNSGGLIDAALQCSELVLPFGRVIEQIDTRPTGVRRIKNTLTPTERVEETIDEEGQRDVTRAARRQPMLNGKPVVVLINGRTGSSAEIFLSVLLQYGKAHGSVVVCGDAATVAKGLTQSFTDIYGEDLLQMTEGVWLDANGVWFGDLGLTTANGVQPQRYTDAPRVVPEAYALLCKSLGKPLQNSAPRQSNNKTVGFGGLLVAGALGLVLAAALTSNRRTT